MVICNGVRNDGLLKKNYEGQIVRLRKGEEITKVFKNSNFFDREYLTFLKIGERIQEIWRIVLRIY